MRLNHFSDTWNVWVPFPSNTYDATFLNFVHSKGILRPSKHNNYAEAAAGVGNYTFMSYNVYLDEDIRHIERRFDTFLTLVSDVGGISRGLTLIFGLVLLQWRTYNRDSNLSTALLSERKKTTKAMSAVNNEIQSGPSEVKSTRLINTEIKYRTNPEQKEYNNRFYDKMKKLKEWVQRRFEGRGEFRYPSYCAYLSCC